MGLGVNGALVDAEGFPRDGTHHSGRRNKCRGEGGGCSASRLDDWQHPSANASRHEREVRTRKHEGKGEGERAGLEHERMGKFDGMMHERMDKSNGLTHEMMDKSNGMMRERMDKSDT